MGESGKALDMELRKAVFNSTKTSSGNVTVDPCEIYDSFTEFYEDVYKSCPSFRTGTLAHVQS